MKNTLTLLDCTLRDGGYYNRWDFGRDRVTRYLSALSKTGIQFVELGFRFRPQEGFLGAHAYTTDRYLDSLPLPEELEYGVMINATEYTDQDGGLSQLRRSFRKRSDSRVRLVRIATRLDGIEEVRPIADILAELGYDVVLNLMQVGGEPIPRLEGLAQYLSQWPIKALYFADSLGNMTPPEVKTVVEAFRLHYGGDVGIHAHDNTGQALANSFAAIDAGATWVDSTVLGMGRGAGNVRTEFLLTELEKRGSLKGNLTELYQLVMTDFEDLRKKYEWGSNLLYYLSSQYSVHPTYIQVMLSDKRYSIDDLFDTFQRLRETPSKSYSSNRLRDLTHNYAKGTEGDWNPQGWAENRDILIIGPGENGERYKEDLIHFITQKKPVVVGLNISSWLPEEYVTALSACNFQRFQADAPRYESINKPVICPFKSVPDLLRNILEKKQVLDYGMKVEQNHFKVGNTHCILPSPLVLLYTLAVSWAAGAKRVLLAGIDGYDMNDLRHSELVHDLTVCKESGTLSPLIALTPTTLPIRQDSIYAQDLEG